MRSPLPTPRRLAREIRLVTHPQDDAPLYQRLHRQLRAHLLSGQVAPGTRLPSARTLAADLGVVEEEVLRAKEIVDGLLELSRPLPPARERVDLRGLAGLFAVAVMGFVIEN